MKEPLGFLEAHELAKEPTGEGARPVSLLMSGTPDVLSMFVRAEGRRRGVELEVGTLPFNTLQQWLRAVAVEDATDGQQLILFPWDLVPELDWRSGIAGVPRALADLVEVGESTARLIQEKEVEGIWYVRAPVPPILGRKNENELLASILEGTAARLGALVLGSESFDLATYLTSGSPIDARRAGGVAQVLVNAAMDGARVPAKVLVSDLDHVMWSGVVGEDGVDGLECGPSGRGYRHFIYQGLLGLLKEEGVLLCAVSRNDQDLARAPFLAGVTSLPLDDFLAVVGSYEAKSAQVRAIAERLNLGLDAFVFVDDNPVELAEVSRALPEVTALRFPDDERDLGPFLAEVRAQFIRATDLTDEDRNRTELYRARVGGLQASTAEGADIEDFLGSLDMVMTLHDRTRGDRTRAVQLINKTNQFNLNGRRLDDDEVQEVLDAGGALLTASLSDRHGSHGEIIAMLLSEQDDVLSWVMSCRVFQRRVEHAFLLSVMERRGVGRLRFEETSRNAPIAKFLADDAFRRTGEGVELDGEMFLLRHGEARGLFRIMEPAGR